VRNVVFNKRTGIPSHLGESMQEIFTAVGLHLHSLVKFHPHPVDYEMVSQDKLKQASIFNNYPSPQKNIVANAFMFESVTILGRYQPLEIA